jgi:hypothetical protein
MKKFTGLAAALAVVASFVATPAAASAPSCQPYNGQGYCQYTGRAYQVYINSGGEILLYFDTVMPSTAPSSVGIAGVSNFGATIYRMADNPDYAKALYASLLAAQARGATIQVQMWGTYAGYMKLDRIWVYE